MRRSTCYACAAALALAALVSSPALALDSGAPASPVGHSPGLTAADALSVWLRSPPHRANLLSGSHRDAGVGALFATSAPGTFGGAPTLVATLDLGRRRR